MSEIEMFVSQMRVWAKEREALNKQIQTNIETSLEIVRQNGIQLQMLSERQNQFIKEFEEWKKKNSHMFDKVLRGEEKNLDSERIIAITLNQLFMAGELSINGVLNVLGQEPIKEDWANKYYVTKDYLTADVITQGTLFVENSNDRCAQYNCLCCGYSHKIDVSKEDYSEIIVCPKCNGAAVDTFRITKYIHDRYS
ncbi:hypothetical protein PDQ34_26935 [Bacillus cereus]|nr:hypothetical protein [Bacillus cereus]MDA2572749.1 hypothetical protein [Bacillus cereus]